MRTSKPAWSEGVVDRAGDHVSLTYGDSLRPMALVAPDRRDGFTVQFLFRPDLGQAQRDKMLAEMRDEMTFYLLHAVGSDSWAFVQYHCDTPANHRSKVHWTWHPKRPQPARRLSPDRVRAAGGQRD